MKKVALVWILGVFLSLQGCGLIPLSPETQQRLDLAESRYDTAVLELREALASGLATAEEMKVLREREKESLANLEKIEKIALEERISAAAETGGETVESITPLVGWALPGSAIILDLIKKGLFGIAAAYRRKGNGNGKTATT